MPDSYPARSRRPHDDSAAEAKTARPDVRHPGVAPEREERLLGVRGVEPADRRAEEPPHLVPTGRDQPAGHGQPDADPGVPERPPHPVGDVEFEHRDRSARADDPGQLAYRRRGVVDVTEEVREGEVVERRVGEGKLVGRGLDELDAPAEALPGAGEHLRALVEPRHAEAARDELRGDEAGARCDVEDVAAVAREPRDEKPPPAGSCPKESAAPTRS